MGSAKSHKPSAVRWVIKADGIFVDAVYTSRQAAMRRAWEYEQHCIHQDPPVFPAMTVEEERLEAESENA